MGGLRQNCHAQGPGFCSSLGRSGLTEPAHRSKPAGRGVHPMPSSPSPGPPRSLAIAGLRGQLHAAQCGPGVQGCEPAVPAHVSLPAGIRSQRAGHQLSSQSQLSAPLVPTLQAGRRRLREVKRPAKVAQLEHGGVGVHGTCRSRSSTTREGSSGGPRRGVTACAVLPLGSAAGCPEPGHVDSSLLRSQGGGQMSGFVKAPGTP